MIAAMDVVGNPSSVHGEGRAATAIIENARRDISAAIGASGADIVFTSGATEAAALALHGRTLSGFAGEHDCIDTWIIPDLTCDADGRVTVTNPAQSTVQTANSETGVLQDLPEGLALTDAVQAVGKVPFAFSWSGADMAILSAHKFGGPKGVGALVLRQGLDVDAILKGGGQEMSRRAGTENIIGIAGMAAALTAAIADMEAGVWDRVEKLRNILENALAEAAPDLIFFGKGARRLPNTSTFALPGWKGETQVMQMDLAGYAVSAGSACSSGKVGPSRVLKAMGADDVTAASAIRVSLGPSTTEDEIMGFVEAWTKQYRRHIARAA